MALEFFETYLLFFQHVPVHRGQGESGRIGAFGDVTGLRRHREQERREEAMARSSISGRISREED